MLPKLAPAGLVLALPPPPWQTIHSLPSRPTACKGAVEAIGGY